MPTRVRSNGGYSLEGGLTFAQLGVRSPQALFITITPNYFKTLQVPILKGRDFSDADADGAPLVCIINEAMAKAAFGSADPIGRRLMGGLDLATGPDKTRYMSIVGVVGNLRAADPALPPQPQLYHPYQQHPFPASAMTFMVRTPDDPLQVSHAVTQLIRAANPDVAIKINTMDATLGAAVAAPRFRTILLALFAGLALVLAMAGVYGIVSFTAAQRTSEMGLRMALGAQQSEIIRLTLASGLKLTAIGVVLGWAIAFALARVLSSMLYEVPVRDPVVFAVAPLVLVAVACLASMAPALRASRVDPSIALRVE